MRSFAVSRRTTVAFALTVAARPRLALAAMPIFGVDPLEAKLGRCSSPANLPHPVTLGGPEVAPERR
jgi:hypothetical protein